MQLLANFEGSCARIHGRGDPCVGLTPVDSTVSSQGKPHFTCKTARKLSFTGFLVVSFQKMGNVQNLKKLSTALAPVLRRARSACGSISRRAVRMRNLSGGRSGRRGESGTRTASAGTTRQGRGLRRGRGCGPPARSSRARRRPASPATSGRRRTARKFAQSDSCPWFVSRQNGQRRWTNATGRCMPPPAASRKSRGAPQRGQGTWTAWSSHTR